MPSSFSRSTLFKDIQSSSNAQEWQKARDRIADENTREPDIPISSDLTPFRDIDPGAPPYTFVRRLGAGANGAVDAVAVTHKDWKGDIIPELDPRNVEAFALKTFRSPRGGTKGTREAQKHEYDILKKLLALPPHKQKHMVKLHDIYSVNEGTTSAQHYLVMSPIADPGNLVVFLNKQQPGDPALLKIMGCLITGLAILLEAKIRHHDIHPWNILVHKGVPLYTDFGLSYDFENSKQSRTEDDTRHQSQFAAPEYFNNHFRDSKSEIFALGGVLYEIIAVYLHHSSMLKYRATVSETRFGIREECREARMALQGDAMMKTADHISNLWLNIINFMLEPDHKHRPSLNAIMDFAKRNGYGAWSVCDDCTRWR